MAEKEKKELTDRQKQDIYDEYEKSFDQREQKPAFKPRGRFHAPGKPRGHGKPVAGTDEFIRIRLPNPKNREVVGTVLEDFGQKLLVKCIDGFTRTCRIPGKIRYKVYINPGDAVLIQKWPVQENEKGDYLYRYTKTQVNHLIKKEFLKETDLQ